MRQRIIVFIPFISVVLMMLILAGCAGKIVLPPFKPSSETTVQPEPGPPVQPEQTQPQQNQPEQTHPEQTQPEPPSTAAEKPVNPEEPLPPLQPALGPAASVYNQGESYLKEGKLGKAEMFLERALSIEPRNPYYWHALATIRLRQGKKQEAVQCCLKSNSLAFGNRPLILQNNALINRAQSDGAADADLP